MMLTTVILFICETYLLRYKPGYRYVIYVILKRWKYSKNVNRIENMIKYIF